MTNVDPFPVVSTPSSGSRAAVEDALKLVEGRKRRAQLTKGARFEASRRHKFTNRSSSYAIVVLSVWIFALSVYSVVHPGMDNKYLNALNLILSFFVVSFSLLQSAKKHELRSEMFLKCAQDIDAMATELSLSERKIKTEYHIELDSSQFSIEITRSITEEIFEAVGDFDQKYQKVLMSFSDNHSDMDYNVYSFKSHRNPKGAKGIDWWKLTIESIYWRILTFWYIRNTLLLSIFLPICALAFRPIISEFFAGHLYIK